MNTNQKGNIALGKAINYFTEQGYIVSLPLNDCQCYDIIIEKDGILQTVQIKYTSRQNSSGRYFCGLLVKSNGTIYYTLKDTFCNLLYCYCENGDEYLIPVSKINTKNEITLMAEYKIHKDIEENIDKVEGKKFHKPSIVKQYTLSGEYIASYNNYSEAARGVGKEYHGAGNHIADVCKGTRNSAYGYQWKEE